MPCFFLVPATAGFRTASAQPWPAGASLSFGGGNGKPAEPHFRGRHLLLVPEMKKASVVKVHPSIGAATLRTALVMAGKTVSCLNEVHEALLLRVGCCSVLGLASVNFVKSGSRTAVPWR